MSLSMVAAVCAASFANPHPHVVRTAEDAKATTYAETVEDANSERGRLFWNYWSSIYEAKRDGSVWRLTPTVPGARFKGEGTNITIDAKTGCVISEVSVD